MWLRLYTRGKWRNFAKSQIYSYVSASYPLPSPTYLSLNIIPQGNHWYHITSKHYTTPHLTTSHHIKTPHHITHITPHHPYHITPHHITPHHITSKPYTTPHLTTSHHIKTPYHITSHHITSHHIRTQHNTTQHNTSSHHTTPHHITPHRTAPHRTVPYRTAPHHTTPHHITTKQNKTKQNNTTQQHDTSALQETLNNVCKSSSSYNSSLLLCLIITCLFCFILKTFFTLFSCTPPAYVGLVSVRAPEPHALGVSWLLSLQWWVLTQMSVPLDFFTTQLCLCERQVQEAQILRCCLFLRAHVLLFNSQKTSQSTCKTKLTYDHMFFIIYTSYALYHTHVNS